jgi:aryl-alcohol dehydrogenase-like predicted oxidoreductase
MDYRTLGRTELQVSPICFGTWSFGGEWGDVQAADAKAAVRRAFELGINFFDTAQAYGFGASEALLGEALRPKLTSRRHELVIATKGGLRREGDRLVRDASPEWLRKGIESSLRALDTDYIDLYQVHWPDPATPFAETAAALDAMVREGKIRYVGVSNFDVEQMEAFARTRRVDALQPPYHLFRREIEQTILPYAYRHGIGMLVYGPMAHGLLAGTFTPDTSFPADDWRASSDVFHGEVFRRNLAIVDELKRFAQARGYTVAQLAIAWTLTNPAVDVAIVGARRPSQIEQTAPAAAIRLSAEELAEIDRITRPVVPVGGPAPEAMPSEARVGVTR